MFKFLRYGFISFALLALVACGNSNTPEGVVDAFFTNISKGNGEKAMELVDLGGELNAQEMAAAKSKLGLMFQMMVDEAKKKGEDIGKFKIEGTTYSEDKNSAVVKITFSGKDNSSTENIDVVKKDGKWKVLLK